jgi:hypothetical protein
MVSTHATEVAGRIADNIRRAAVRNWRCWPDIRRGEAQGLLSRP